DMGILLAASWLFDGHRFIEKGAVWIDGGDIRFAGPAGNVPRECPAERKDFGEATISPGFIDLHIHCLGTRDYSVNAFLMEDERGAALRMVPRLRELLEAGFTSARDCGSGPGVPLRDAIVEGSIQGPRLCPARAGISQT